MYFASLDNETNVQDEEHAQKLRQFQKLVAPVVSGQKTSIIQCAQIRQATKRAAVPLDAADRFLDFADDDHPSLPFASTSEDDQNRFSNWEEMDGLDEDDAIAAFLTRFGALKCGGHFEKGDTNGIEEFTKVDLGSNEEAVEVDAIFGYVNKELAPKEQDIEEEW
jgi:hypothetical protein